MILAEHDVPPGKLDRCQITGSADLFEVLDLGVQPPCDSMLTEKMLDADEPRYPLRLMLCAESGLAQLDYVVDGATIYHPDYPYRSGVTPQLVAYQGVLAREVASRIGMPPGSRVVDVGSNDGTLLSAFASLGFDVLGVEPTNVAAIARERGIETEQAFFGEGLAALIADRSGQADLVTMTNVFAHMANLGDVCRGICRLLRPDGVFVTESHYLLDVLEKTQFDTIYHEHIRTYSLRALVTLFEQYGLQVFDVQRGDRYGGNIRAYVARRGTRKVMAAVGQMLRAEEDAGLFDQATWSAFRERVERERDAFMEWLRGARAAGFAVAGQGCPGRCVTLLNYYGVTADQIPFISELPGSLKIGLYVPGARIPVVSAERMLREQPDYVVINPWHYRDGAVARLRSEGVRGKMVVALPAFEVLAA